jgi:hypothetical protein
VRDCSGAAGACQLKAETEDPRSKTGGDWGEVSPGLKDSRQGNWFNGNVWWAFCCLKTGSVVLWFCGAIMRKYRAGVPGIMTRGYYANR